MIFIKKDYIVLTKSVNWSTENKWTNSKVMGELERQRLWFNSNINLIKLGKYVLCFKKKGN